MMNELDHDPMTMLTAELSGLAADPPRQLFDRIAARWVLVPGPVGGLYVAFTDHGISYVRVDSAVRDEAEFAGEFRGRFGRPLLAAGRPPAGLLPALRTGRTGKLRFDLRDLRSFQRDVLLATAQIPPGEVRPYSWVARQIGRPKAVRAVGTALGRNPVPVLIGCHRVVPMGGGTGPYIFGPDLKRQLLQAEGMDLHELEGRARTRRAASRPPELGGPREPGGPPDLGGSPEPGGPPDLGGSPELGGPPDLGGSPELGGPPEVGGRHDQRRNG